MDVASPDHAERAVEILHVATIKPIKRRHDVPSLWSYFFPTALAVSREVVCLKWFQGRATLFDRDSFVCLLAFFESPRRTRQLSPLAQRILEYLVESSPHTNRAIKTALEIAGAAQVKEYKAALRELAQRGFVVEWGHGAKPTFPAGSLGAAQLLFEDCWTEAARMSAEHAERQLESILGAESAFLKYARKIKKQF